MKRLISALCVGGLLTLNSVWAAPDSVTQDSGALSSIPPPADVSTPAAQSSANAVQNGGQPQNSATPSVDTAPLPQNSATPSADAAALPQNSATPSADAAALPQSSATDAGMQPAATPMQKSQPPVMNTGQPQAVEPVQSTPNGSAAQAVPAGMPPTESAAQAAPAGMTPTESAAQAAPAGMTPTESATQAAPAGMTPTESANQSAPADAAPTDSAQPSAQASSSPLPAGLPPLPPVDSAAPPASSLIINQPLSTTVTVGQMGQPRGMLLTGRQLQSGIVFTLPADEVVTNARMNLSLRVSPALAARNTSLQLMLNGQPLGTLPLSASDSASQDYQLDIPAAMVVSSNNLSFKINEADQLLCERDSGSLYQLTILPNSTLSLDGQQLNIGNRLSNFPRPFIDPLRMTPSSVSMIFGQQITPGEVSAAATVASWLGIQTDYRGIDFPVVRNDLPEKNGFVFASPGEVIGGLVVPRVSGPTLQMVDNPLNPVYKLMLVIGNSDEELRQAAWRLTQPLDMDASTLAVGVQNLPLRKAWDAPRWIRTDRPVRLGELLRKDQSLTTTGIGHDALRVNFRAAPDLFLWDGDTLPIQVNYRFPSESWIDEDKSWLNVSLNGTFLRSLTVNKVGLLESIWHRLGGDARLEEYTLKLDPYLIYGDNQLQFYFNIAPKASAPCSVLTSNNIKSHIEDDAYIDLSHTRHFALLPNLSYFVGASFPFSRFADYSQTVLMLPPAPGNAEISTLLDMAGRSGNATGVALSNNVVMFGLPKDGQRDERLHNSDVLAVSTLTQTDFNQSMLEGTRYRINGPQLGVAEPGLLDNLRSWLTGDWFGQAVDADRYLSSNDAWRGFISYRSPWNSTRLVVMTIATNDSQLARLHEDLTLPRINAGIRGDTAIITDENGIRSFRVGAQFPSGQMPWYMMVVWYASQHAVVLAVLALLLCVAVGLSTCALLRRHAWKRLNPQQDARSSGEKK
ncbi:cellulose biosynthesis cyclic di-GMP-binding regulatory protein BcsB [Erwinia sp. HDF1-3R]|uniref:cellulose biosynthesis cyclic di-GMP-binding regulatory protein BcsB n=1 Tax=Erwinia sp. HDF1-3R TaxID=3141543 RepID=UPI0031F5723E